MKCKCGAPIINGDLECCHVCNQPFNNMTERGNMQEETDQKIRSRKPAILDLDKIVECQE